MWANLLAHIKIHEVALEMLRVQVVVFWVSIECVMFYLFIQFNFGTHEASDRLATLNMKFNVIRYFMSLCNFSDNTSHEHVSKYRHG